MTNSKKPIPKKSLRLKSKRSVIKNFPNEPNQKQNPFKLEWDFSKPDSFEYHASCPDGLSGLLKEEILEAGLKIISENRGGVFFKVRRAPSRNSLFLLESHQGSVFL
ncbi:hypothetical protein LEP1GSC123_0315 [Leptospira borgpetersenii str. 200701203]|uniref:Uncharacterized protein n=1 Tax=Leptospira borgpetersenii str. 200701203 TaxID=1193007 RepID=M3H405_LEPBO|nr:hypothetical protein LEP1GSC123_0315 [Leptospira borgpetersenii str. 200701203]